jgi:hypothetical protein
MEEILRGMQDKITELQTKCNTVRKVTVSPVIPFSLFICGPAGEDAAYLPPGRVTQIAINLIGPKDATLALSFITPESTLVEELTLKAGAKLLMRNMEVKEWTVVRAKLGTDDLTARLIIGFNFHPTATYVSSKGDQDAGIIA